MLRTKHAAFMLSAAFAALTALPSVAQEVDQAGLDRAREALAPYAALPVFTPPGEAFDAVACAEGVKMLSIPNSSANPFLKGIIDRIDIREGRLRVLDYKTGIEKLSDCEDTEELFTKPNHKLNLQLLLYVLLVKHNFTAFQALPAVAGIFKLREFDNDITWLNQGMPVEDAFLLDFQKRLVELIQEIFNPEIPFEPTSDVKRCKYCDYKVMCNRQSL